MKVLSLFDGISAGRVALDRAVIKITTYYRSEIDKFANQVAVHNYPNDIQLGDVTKWREWDIDWASIDLLIGGSPCQGFSFAGKQLAFDDPRSKLFFVYVDILNHIKSLNPNIKFLLENVKMKKEYLDVISEHLGVQPILINSALVSAQNRQRYYWCNWKVLQPNDKGIILNDILQDNPNSKHILSNKAIDYMSRLRNGKPRWEYHKNDQFGKSSCLTANMYKGIPYGVLRLVNQSQTKNKKSYSLTASYNGAVAWNSIERKQRTMIPLYLSSEKNPNNYDGIVYRKLTPIECERLQTFPDNYTAVVSNSQRYKALGNSWTVDIIYHLLKYIF